MNISEIVKIILVCKFADELESSLEQDEISHHQFKQVFVAQADLMDTVPNALGDETLNKSIDSLVAAQAVFVSKELISHEDITEKDVAFYLLGHENDIPEEFSSEKFLSMKEVEIDNAVYDLVQSYCK